MFKYFYIIVAVFFLNCKNNNIGQNKISTNSSSNTDTALESNTSVDSILNWQDQQIGSDLLLNDFPEFWSYTSITNEEYDSNSENKFNVLLEDIDSSNDISPQNTINITIDYIGNNDFIPYYDSFYQFNEEVSENSFKPIRVFKLNQTIFVSLFEVKTISYSKISKRIDVVVFNKKNEIIDGLNISLAGSGDQHTFAKYFYINKGIITYRNFYFYDGESSSSSLFKFYIEPSGRIIQYFDEKQTSYNGQFEKGEIKNNTKDGDWVEIRPNRFAKVNTYLEASYKEGKRIGKWNYYNLTDNNQKGSKLLMTEKYSEEGKLLKREIFKNK